ncbi:hypothetical protein RQP46_007597 [Phenoliferia psychrophenolica]
MPSSAPTHPTGAAAPAAGDSPSQDPPDSIGHSNTGSISSAGHSVYLDAGSRTASIDDFAPAAQAGERGPSAGANPDDLEEIKISTEKSEDGVRDGIGGNGITDGLSSSNAADSVANTVLPHLPVAPLPSAEEPVSPSPASTSVKYQSEKSSGSKEGGGQASGDDAVVNVEGHLFHLSAEQKKIVPSQAHVPEKKQASFASLFRLGNRKEILLNCIGVLAAIVAGVAQPLMTIVFGNLTNTFTKYSVALANANASPEGAAAYAAVRAKLFSSVNTDVLYLVYIGIAMYVATWLYMGTFVYTGEAITRRIRETYLRAVLRQNVAYFDAVGPGDIVTRIQVDTHLVQEGISDKVPCLGGSGATMGRFLGKYRLMMLDEIVSGGTLAEEAISSVRTLVAFGSQGHLVSLYNEHNLRTSAATLATGLTLLFFIIYASSGTLVGVFMAVLMASFSLAQISPNLQAFAYAQGAAATLYTTIDRVPPIDSSSDEGLSPKHVDAVIEVEHVDFFYPSRPSVQVLHDFSAVFPKGKMTALVGASGSGKSTLVGLVERFYDPANGIVKLDGHDIKIGLVSQEPTLFATTVAGNIEHGLIGTEFEAEGGAERRARVVAAAKKANADGFISALPQGYDTM